MTTLCLLAMTGLLAAQQSPADPRAEAERLARTGSYAEALRRFESIATTSPDDLEARVWIGRLRLWTGHADRAADVFRSVLSVNPERTDALVGLGQALTELGEPEEAVNALNQAERLAPDDAAVQAAQGAAHLSAGRVRLGLAYYHRAMVLRPGDPAIRDGYEDARRRYGHALEAVGYVEAYDAPTPDAWSGSIVADVRLGDPLRLIARGQQQRRFDETDQRGGAGLDVRASQRWTVRGRVLYGGSSTVLPRLDAGGEATFTKRRWSVAGGVQYVSFRPGLPGPGSVRTWIASPSVTVQLRRSLSLVGRYAHLETEFASTGGWISGESGLVGLRGRPTRRVLVGVAWAGGVEDFDTLSIDRLGDFRANTLRGDVRLDLPSLTSLGAIYEYQWREHDRRVARVTVRLAQRF